MRLVLGCDRRLVRAGLRALLERVPEAEVVAEAEDGTEALALLDRYRPDLALLDASLSGLNGAEVARRATRVSPRTRVLLLGSEVTEAGVARAVRAGAAGILDWRAAPLELELALRAAMRGDRYLSPGIAAGVVDRLVGRGPAADDPLATLSARQREILQLVAEGRPTRDIASRLTLSVKTVEAHRTKLMRRLGVRDVPALVRIALRSGVIALD